MTYDLRPRKAIRTDALLTACVDSLPAPARHTAIHLPPCIVQLAPHVRVRSGPSFDQIRMETAIMVLVVVVAKDASLLD